MIFIFADVDNSKSGESILTIRDARIDHSGHKFFCRVEYCLGNVVKGSDDSKHVTLLVRERSSAYIFNKKC